METSEEYGNFTHHKDEQEKAKNTDGLFEPSFLLFFFSSSTSSYRSIFTDPSKEVLINS